MTRWPNLQRPRRHSTRLSSCWLIRLNRITLSRSCVCQSGFAKESLEHSWGHKTRVARLGAFIVVTLAVLAARVRIIGSKEYLFSVSVRRRFQLPTS
jgi:hypothetical protein